MGQGFFLRVQGLVFASNLLLRKFAMVCTKGTFWISAKRSFCQEVILDNAHMSYGLNS